MNAPFAEKGPSAPARGQSVEAIQAWMVAQVAAELGIDPTEIDVRKPLARYGLDSMSAVVLSGDLEAWLGRPLSAGLLGEYATIEALARHLAGGTSGRIASAGGAAAESNPTREPETYRPRERPSLFRSFFRRVTVLLVRLLARVEVEGRENVPDTGPLVLATNHLHITDTPIVWAVLPRETVFFVSDHMQRFPMVDWFLRKLGQAIYVTRGEADLSALQRALAVLEKGGTLAIAPEGRISRSGGLIRGRSGVAYLATRSGVPILPVVAFGQEKAFRSWRRFRRVAVRVRVGPLTKLPAGNISLRQLETYTEEVMLQLARLLPREYRGVYSEGVQGQSETASEV